MASPARLSAPLPGARYQLETRHLYRDKSAMAPLRYAAIRAIERHMANYFVRLVLYWGFSPFSSMAIIGRLVPLTSRRSPGTAIYTAAGGHDEASLMILLAHRVVASLSAPAATLCGTRHDM